MGVSVTLSTEPGPQPTIVSLLTRDRWVEICRIVAVAIVALLFQQHSVPALVLWIAVAVGLYPLVKTGLRELFRERKIGTAIFITLATLIAVLGGEAVAGSVLMIIILIAEFIAELNTDRARASIKGLIGSVPQTATVRTDNQERAVPISGLQIDDIVLVRAGEKLPVDGVIVGGSGSINEAPITGESVPKDKANGAGVFAGTVLESGAIDVKTERVGSDTMFARIAKLVEEAEDSQAPVQRLADRVAAWLIPVVLVFLVAVYLLTRDIRKIVTLMIFTSPAELGLATPMVMIAAIARAARSGILVKGGVYLELLSKVDTVVFDKTGTLTTGQPAVLQVESLDPAVSSQEVLRAAAAADRRSGHPIAKAVVEHAIQSGLELPEPSSFEVLRGRGIRAVIEDKPVLVGNEALMAENGITAPSSSGSPNETLVYVAVESRVIGRIHVADTMRPGAREVIAGLRASGVKRVIMLTGDNRATAEAIAAQTGIDEARSELLPEAKVACIAELQAQKHIVAMVGDGINDAPALAKADVGIAMGAAGTQAAIEAADIALMGDDLSKIVVGRTIARKAYRTIQENLIVGVGVVHVLGIIAALLGWIGPIQAAVLHLGPDILVFLNSIKLLRMRL
ncbi:MAG: cadmium-translocating P-type ATPase [Bryobacterales bacterium]|nr:cadmium-translocating P-type ATPase [Bryobacterales bacterium]